MRASTEFSLRQDKFDADEKQLKSALEYAQKEASAMTAQKEAVEAELCDVKASLTSDFEKVETQLSELEVHKKKLQADLAAAEHVAAMTIDNAASTETKYISLLKEANLKISALAEKVQNQTRSNDSAQDENKKEFDRKMKLLQEKNEAKMQEQIQNIEELQIALNAQRSDAEDKLKVSVATIAQELMVSF